MLEMREMCDALEKEVASVFGSNHGNDGGRDGNLQLAYDYRVRHKNVVGMF